MARSKKAILKCAEWLAFCLREGWPRSDLDRLEELWWSLRDDNGNLRSADRGGERT